MHENEKLGRYIIDTYENGDSFDWYIGENPENPDGDSKDAIRALAVLDSHVLLMTRWNIYII